MSVWRKPVHYPRHILYCAASLCSVTLTASFNGGPNWANIANSVGDTMKLANKSLECLISVMKVTDFLMSLFRLVTYYTFGIDIEVHSFALDWRSVIGLSLCFQSSCL